MSPLRVFLANRQIPTFRVANVIGSGTTARGDLKGPGGFRVDGTVEGTLESDAAVVVGEDGTIDGSVRARDIVVLGRVRGDLVATGHLEIGPKGKVVGDITVKSIKMHEGGVFRGTSRMSGAEELTTATNPFGMLPVAVSETPGAVANDAPRGGRTLPPPVGAVPPPPPESAPAMSEERLVLPPSSTKNVANG